ncbi:hypothetical protein ACP70R_003832 [Stipagrostis hirtigluma subsp. patula]
MAVWKEWVIQALVLLSFTLQLELLILAELRRRIDSGVLRAFVWSAYLLADSTAIYALGHLSVTNRSPEHQLMAFWAPFLLLHLGGQDNITAYAIEDNRLWLRHLQTLAVQVGAAAYVLYESSVVGSRPSLLRPAGVLMFVAGVAKYGERVWALKCSDSTPSANKYRSFRALTVHTEGPSSSSSSPRDTEELLFIAHLLSDVPNDLLKGPLPEVVVPYLELSGEEAYEVAEMQLSLMHDVFYTKSEVMHSWYGLCIRVASLVAAAASLLLFLLHLLGDHRNEGYNYNSVDVAVTCVLLAGALALEIVSTLRVMFSSWTCTILAKWGHDQRWVGRRNMWNLLGRGIAALRRKTGAARWARYWSASMGQQDLLELCARSRASRISKMARWVGKEGWWNTLAFSSSAAVSASVKQLVVKQVLMDHHAVTFSSPDHIPNSRGQAALSRWGLYKEELALSVGPDIEFECVVVVWHIATGVYLRWYREHHQAMVDAGTAGAPGLAEAAEALSNYMLFLLADRPHMLPSPASRNVYVEMCFCLTGLEEQYHSAGELAGVLRRRGDELGGAPASFLPGHSRPQLGFTDILGNACKLAAKLIGGAEPQDSPAGAEKMEMIAQVWVEILCHAAYRCVAYSHAKQIGNGGELITVVALLLQYIRRIKRQIGRERAPEP